MTDLPISDGDLRTFLIGLVYKLGGSVELSDDDIYNGWMGPTGFPRRATYEKTASGVRISLTPPGAIVITS